ncbi:hypothetical protein [Thermoclostridium caenicola]|nr:hypothetical protein [Thermoclostridium caenicola]
MSVFDKIIYQQEIMQIYLYDGRELAIKRFVLSMTFIMLVAAVVAGCSKSIDASVYNTDCEFYLEGLPEEYNLLPDEIKKETGVWIRLGSVTSDRVYEVLLNEENGFRQSVEGLIPGKYEVNYGVTNSRYSRLRVKVDINNIIIEKNNHYEIPAYMADPSEFVREIMNLQPQDELLNADIFSRKVQYNGRIIDLYNIRDEMKFVAPKDKRLAPKETIEIPSSDHEGVSIIVQNQTQKYIEASEATFTGVRFSRNNNVVFPKAITLGTSLRDLAHASEGIMGTPDYCLGSPVVYYNIDATILVYVDKNSGDRISFHYESGKSYVSSITYEFEKYE